MRPRLRPRGDPGYAAADATHRLAARRRRTRRGTRRRGGPAVSGALAPGVHELVLAHAREASDRANPGAVATDDPALAAELVAEGRPVRPVEAEALAEGPLAAVLLTAEELSFAGEGAEALVDAVAGALPAEGLLVATARNRVFAEAAGLPLGGVRGYAASDLDRLLGHRGFAIDLLCAPGAAGRLRASLVEDALPDAAPLDVEGDRSPGLLDAAPGLLAVARAPRDAADREERFFATLPRKVVAAAVLCRADDGRLLCVYDRFKGHWTIPGGVVDPDESPRDGAEREAWEETGVRVAAGPALGLFAGSWPDRLVIVYDAVPVGGGAPTTGAAHHHEVGEAAWLDLPEALERLAAGPAFQVRRCLAEPGGTWPQPGA